MIHNATHLVPVTSVSTTATTAASSNLYVWDVGPLESSNIGNINTSISGAGVGSFKNSIKSSGIVTGVGAGIGVPPSTSKSIRTRPNFKNKKNKEK